MKVGVLALQGNFREHLAMLDRLGVEGVEVRLPEQLDGLAGLIVPGGESTAIGRLAPPLRARRGDRAVPGAHLRDLRRDDPACPRRRRRDAGSAVARAARRDRAPQRLRTPGVQLRGRPRARRDRAAAPRSVHQSAASRVGWAGRVRVLAELDGVPVLVREGRVLAAAFHPELTDDTRVHELFLQMVREEQAAHVGSQ